ncbi:zinc finger protein 436 [Ixodes scapularis]|uniref:zinc finger protein 436 n=1 Tax=Ixodes scapularis TaxID=6945 RepID=UPI001C383938|nr:zinc finger protein 436 [Ixodes scapularis]
MSADAQCLFVWAVLTEHGFQSFLFTEYLGTSAATSIGYPLLDRDFGIFRCPHCPRRFRHQGHLLRHIKTAHIREAERPFPFLCEQCGLKFDQREGFLEHLSTHASNSAYKCRHCSASFFSEFQLMVHRQKCHPVKCPPYPRASSEGPPADWKAAAVKEEPYRCERCTETFDQPSLLMRHRLTHHTNMELFQCHLCPKDFIRKGHLARHLRTHTPPPP